MRQNLFFMKFISQDSRPARHDLKERELMEESDTLPPEIIHQIVQLLLPNPICIPPKKPNCWEKEAVVKWQEDRNRPLKIAQSLRLVSKTFYNATEDVFKRAIGSILGRKSVEEIEEKDMKSAWIIFGNAFQFLLTFFANRHVVMKPGKGETIPFIISFFNPST